MSILSPLIKKINQEKKVKYLFFVGGTHLIENYGKTVDEIKDLKINIMESKNKMLDSFFLLMFFNRV